MIKKHLHSPLPLVASSSHTATPMSRGPSSAVRIAFRSLFAGANKNENLGSSFIDSCFVFVYVPVQGEWSSYYRSSRESSNFRFRACFGFRSNGDGDGSCDQLPTVARFDRAKSRDESKLDSVCKERLGRLVAIWVST